MTSMRRILSVLVALALLMGMSFVYAAPVQPSALTSALRWRSIGPYVGGRVTTVAGVAGEPNLYYAAYAGGGVWETTDYGYHWKNISDGYFKSNNVGALAVAASNPRIIYAGTGDSAIRNTVLSGDGMYKSTDGGKTWAHIGLEDTHVISWIAVDPNDPNVVYAAALGHVWGPNPERGVYKTTDGGQTWKKVLYVNDQTGAVTLAMDPSDPRVLYATMWQAYRRAWTLSSGGPGSGIYKTTDGGNTWKNITHNPGLPTGIFGKAGIAVAPSNPDVVYALIQADYKGQAGTLFRSDNGGQSWAFVNNSQDITQRSFYYMRVYVDPKDANTIYLPNVGVFASHDGGKTLLTLHPPHGDNHAFWINPNNPQNFIEGNDGGATVTLNGGQTWSSEDNQPTGQFYHANLDDQFPFHVYGSQQDEGSSEGPSAVAAGNIPPIWTPLIGGEATWVVPTPGQPWITYASGDFSLEWRGNRQTEQNANVSPWPSYKYGNGASALKYRYNWMSRPKAFAPHNPKELLLAANVVFRSNDQGANWTVISPDLTRNDKSKQFPSGGPISHDVAGQQLYDTITSVAFSPLNDNVVWTGSDDGLVYVTTDGGTHWNQVRPPQLPAWSWITCVDPSPTAAGTAYVSAARYRWDDFHPYAYKTTDYGKHWAEITSGIPNNEYVGSIRQDPDDPNLMFLGTSSTVYFSLNGGAKWLPLSLNLPVVRVSDIEIDHAQHAVVLATFGRAFWVMDNLQFLEQVSSAQVASNATYLFKPQQAWLVANPIGEYAVPVLPDRGESSAPGAAVFFYLPASYKRDSPVTLSFTDASGTLINSFTLPLKTGGGIPAPNSMHGKEVQPMAELHPGMNRFQWNLRYSDAVHVKGLFYSHFLPVTPAGPEVAPGTYYAVLDYGSTKQKQAFVVKADPRVATTQAELQRRFALQMKIHGMLNRLGTALNQAVDARDALEKASASKISSGRAAQQALTSLNRDIDALVSFRTQSVEGSIVYPSRLYGWLTKMAVQVDFALFPPTAAMTQVSGVYLSDAAKAISRLHSDTANANAALKR